MSAREDIDLEGAALLVEDDPDIRETLIEVLGDAGYRAHGARHGREALEMLRRSPHKPAVILLDLMMPVMNGWQFREEQRQDPALADIPVVVISAYTDVEGKAAGIGARAYLRKPLDLGMLVRTVARWCPEVA